MVTNPTPTPAQDRIVRYVEQHQGALGVRIAEACGPHGSRRYGYAALHRAVDAGRLVGVRDAKRPNWIHWYTRSRAGAAAIHRDRRAGVVGRLGRLEFHPDNARIIQRLTAQLAQPR